MEEKQVWRIVVVMGDPTTQEDAGGLQEKIATLCKQNGYEVMTVAEPYAQTRIIDAEALAFLYNLGKESKNEQTS